MKQALRIFRQSPAFAFAAVAALTLGIGANTAIFSVFNAVVLKPLSIPQADRMVEFMLTFPGGMSDAGSPQNFFVWHQQANIFENVSAHRLELMNLTDGPDPQQLAAARVSADFFRLFDAPILYGRTFTEGEDRPNGGHVVVLSHALWSSRFASDPGIVGKAIPLNGEQYVVVGILGANFNTEQFDQRPAIWVPFQIDPDSTRRAAAIAASPDGSSPASCLGLRMLSFRASRISIGAIFQNNSARRQPSM